MKELIGKKVSIEKIEDTRFNGHHPNHFNTGFKTIGEVKMIDPVLYIDIDEIAYFHTSAIQSYEKIDNDYYLHTLNSVYKVTVIE